MYKGLKSNNQLSLLWTCLMHLYLTFWFLRSSKLEVKLLTLLERVLILNCNSCLSSNRRQQWISKYFLWKVPCCNFCLLSCFHWFLLSVSPYILETLYFHIIWCWCTLSCCLLHILRSLILSPELWDQQCGSVNLGVERQHVPLLAE